MDFKTKQKVVLSCAAAFAIAVVGGGAYLAFGGKSAPAPTQTTTTTTTTTTTAPAPKKVEPKVVEVKQVPAKVEIQRSPEEVAAEIEQRMEAQAKEDARLKAVAAARAKADKIAMLKDGDARFLRNMGYANVTFNGMGDCASNGGTLNNDWHGSSTGMSYNVTRGGSASFLTCISHKGQDGVNRTKTVTHADETATINMLVAGDKTLLGQKGYTVKEVLGTGTCLSNGQAAPSSTWQDAKMSIAYNVEAIKNVNGERTLIKANVCVTHDGLNGEKRTPSTSETIKQERILAEIKQTPTVVTPTVAPQPRQQAAAPAAVPSGEVKLTIRKAHASDKSKMDMIGTLVANDKKEAASRGYQILSLDNYGDCNADNTAKDSWHGNSTGMAYTIVDVKTGVKFGACIEHKGAKSVFPGLVTRR